MKIAVTGGAGFIASQIADAYVAAGHEVIVIDNLITGKRVNVPRGAKFFEADIRAPEIAEIFRSERPQVLSHHAAQLDVRKSVADPAFDADVNLIGTLNLLEAAREVGVSRVLFASSGGAVYGEQEIFPAPESHPHHPISPYGITKATGELYLAFYNAVHGIPYVALRYSNVYGPRQDPHGEAGVVAIFAGHLLNGEPCTVFGDGSKTRDYVFVGDVVEATVRAAAGPPGVVANVGWGREVSDLDLFRTMATATGYTKQPTFAADRHGDVARSCLDAGLAQRTWDWRPVVPLADGVRRVVEYART
jgi:UDP-glucose 4-epimerase